MIHKATLKTCLVGALLAATGAAMAAENSSSVKHTGPVCEGYGPQSPRDIDVLTGTNSVNFQIARPSSEMNLCNIHFHNNAEHKAKDFSILSGAGDKRGYQCSISNQLTSAELKAPKGDVCNGLKPGDTVEIHWVHSSCDVSPGVGLGACVSDKCLNPELRVEAQVFTLVNDKSAMQFGEFNYDKGSEGDYHQPASLPITTGSPVEYLGSTTGPKYSEQQCSPYQVTWSVRPHCAKLDINSLAKWCESNVFKEDHAHGVRKLVVTPSLLSEIK
ncbi:delta-class carbonic anhydrase [Sessilibacter corallicola]|uniref:Cadmium carbonic anhydrase n=1 Tax=Sessilibacter corallicola TaxID=2904075 RepID=A0ABQ0A442_9GAMM|nr:hypothetical protein [Sessilibacter corallicola]